jgi:hypothetical protein
MCCVNDEEKLQIFVQIWIVVGLKGSTAVGIWAAVPGVTEEEVGDASKAVAAVSIDLIQPTHTNEHNRNFRIIYLYKGIIGRAVAKGSICMNFSFDQTRSASEITEDPYL